MYYVKDALHPQHLPKPFCVFKIIGLDSRSNPNIVICNAVPSAQVTKGTIKNTDPPTSTTT